MAVAVCCGGVGGAREGAGQGSMNRAGIWRLPLLFVCEKNRWGVWTRTESFLFIMALLGGAALVLFLLVRKIAAMMHGVK